MREDKEKRRQKREREERLFLDADTCVCVWRRVSVYMHEATVAATALVADVVVGQASVG